MKEVHPMWIKEIIKRLRSQEKILVIHRATGIHRCTIRAVLKLAQKNDWLNPQKPAPNEGEIYAEYKATLKPRTHRFDIYQEDFKIWVEQGYSYKVMHQLLKKRLDCSETAIRNFVKKHFPKHVDPVMIRKTIPGEVMDVDFGYLGIVTDDKAKKRKAWVFSGRLRYSRKAFREVVFRQHQTIFFQCVVHSLEYFNGVPSKVCLDNLKAGVIKWTIDLEFLNRSFLDLADHYGFQISPCKPRKPEHKGGVENDVKYIKRNFWPLFLEEQRSKGREILQAQALQSALDQWTIEIADKRTVAQVGRTPDELFESEERDKLLPLPFNRWDPITWREAKVSKAWRVRFENAFYSVSYHYIGETVMICANSKQVRIYFDFKEIALHAKATEEWGYICKREHAPPEHEEVLGATKEGLAIWAEKIGPFTYELARRLLGNKKIDKLQPVRFILQLSKKYTNNSLENACRRCLYYELISYVSVKKVLEEGKDKEPLEEEVREVKKEKFRFCRNKDDYCQTDLKNKRRKV